MAVETENALVRFVLILVGDVGVVVDTSPVWPPSCCETGKYPRRIEGSPDVDDRDGDADVLRPWSRRDNWSNIDDKNE